MAWFGVLPVPVESYYHFSFIRVACNMPENLFSKTRRGGGGHSPQLRPWKGFFALQRLDIQKFINLAPLSVWKLPLLGYVHKCDWH